MPRALSVSRASVTGANQPAYLATLGALAARLREHGESLWLFRHAAANDIFLEFSESPSAERHRTRRARDPAELALERELHTLAAYAPEAGELWREVPLETP